MQVDAQALSLRLKTPFRIAHGTSTERDNVLVYINDGVGVAALTPYYPAQVPDVLEYVQGEALQTLLAESDIAHLEDILGALPDGPAPARAAVDLALHDLWGQHLGQPLYRLWGLNPARAPYSTLTLSMDDDENAYRAAVREVRHLPVLKLKLGTGSIEQDEALVRMAREETGAQLCIDANAAWSVAEAATVIPRLAAYDMLFIEQPLGQHDIQGWHDLALQLPPDMPPLIADESLHDSRDILPLAGAIDGINIKLAKCGGLREARRMITLARSLGMQVMLGCMVESAVGVTAAAHLAPLVDFADLDGNLSVLNDPYDGVGWEDGHLILADRPGLGVTRRA